MRSDLSFSRIVTGCLGIVVAVTLCLAARSSPAAEALEPAASLPAVTAVSADDYYILLLKWSRSVVMKPVTARVVYLDPPLDLAWLKQANPDITQAQFTTALEGFPRVLRFRIGYQAASRKFLQTASWKPELIANGKHVPATSGHRVEAATLESNATDTYWEEQWEYEFDVPADFLSTSTKSFGIALAGPAGSGTARWRFGVTTEEISHPDAYVPYLGTTLLAFSIVAGVGLVLTRRPRRRLS